MSLRNHNKTWKITINLRKWVGVRLECFQIKISVANFVIFLEFINFLDDLQVDSRSEPLVIEQLLHHNNYGHDKPVSMDNTT